MALLGGGSTPVTAGFVAILLLATITDLRTRRIPNALTYPAILIALLLAASQGSLTQALVGGLVGAALFILPIILYGPKGAGGGDVKLAAFIGCMLGLTGTLTALFVAGVVASVVLLLGLATRRLDRRSPIPFGPFLAVGALVVVLMLRA